MSYVGYTLIAGEFLRFAWQVLIIGMAAGLVFWFTWAATAAARTRARLACRRWRAERALRGEVTRGLAQIEAFLSARRPPPASPEPDGRKADHPADGHRKRPLAGRARRLSHPSVRLRRPES